MAIQELGLRAIQPSTGQLLGRGAHVKVKFGEELGRPVISKTYDFSSSDKPREIEIKDIITYYLLYRDKVGQVFSIPEFYGYQTQNPGCFSTTEEAINGISGYEIVRRGNMEEIAILARAILLPLAATRIAPVRLSDKYYSKYPVSTPIDAKPDNYIVDTNKGILYCIDFMPPRLRGEDGLIFPSSQLLDARDPARMAYFYGDLIPLLTRFWTSCIVDHYDSIEQAERQAPHLAQIFTTLTLEIDQTDRLLLDILADLHTDSVRTLFQKSDIHRVAYKYFTEGLYGKH